MIELTLDEHKILVDAIQDSATVVHKGRKDMNERILDICIKAGINTWPFNEVGFISLDESELVKFAELIVRECALVAKTLPHTPERHWVQDSVTYIPVHCEQNILKHFGVEE